MNSSSSAVPEHHASGVASSSIAGILIIFFLGFAGSVVPPLLTKHMPKFDLNRNIYFRFFNGFAAGIVLAVGYIHSLSDASDSWNDVAGDSTSLTDTYAWFGFIAMMGGLICFFVEEFVHRNMSRFTGMHGHSHKHTHDEHRMSHAKAVATHVHSHHAHDHDDVPRSPDLDYPGSKSDGANPATSGDSMTKMEEGHDSKKSESELNKADYFTELWVLFFGLSFHSIFVGLALGLEPNNWGLFAAIVFHQFFEGLALGARVARADFKKALHFWLLDFAYALTVPVGIAIGMGIYSAVEDGSRSYSIINGIFQALSGGILIYVSTVHMMKEEMGRPEFNEPGCGPRLRALYIGFLLGAGAMAIIGIWA